MMNNSISPDENNQGTFDDHIHGQWQSSGSENNEIIVIDVDINHNDEQGSFELITTRDGVVTEQHMVFDRFKWVGENLCLHIGENRYTVINADKTNLILEKFYHQNAEKEGWTREFTRKY